MELRKIADGRAVTADFPPCPVCRGWVAHFDTINDGGRLGMVLDPCGCIYTVGLNTDDITITKGN